MKTCIDLSLKIWIEDDAPSVATNADERRNFDTLEVGGVYFTRHGAKVQIEHSDIDPTWPFGATNGKSYMPDGTYLKPSQPHPLDLVARIDAAATQQAEPTHPAPARNFETLELGKYYRRRDGKVARIVGVWLTLTYPFLSEVGGINSESYLPNGRVFNSEESDADLVECLGDQLPQVRNFDTLAIGKRYKDRRGNVHLIAMTRTGSVPFRSEAGGSWMPDGRHCDSPDCNLHLIECLD